MWNNDYKYSLLEEDELDEVAVEAEEKVDKEEEEEVVE